MAIRSLEDFLYVLWIFLFPIAISLIEYILLKPYYSSTDTRELCVREAALRNRGSRASYGNAREGHGAYIRGGDLHGYLG